jgi:catechol 2,3-dioxygenase-like lactoylglutathione lyase family enzyme
MIDHTGIGVADVSRSAVFYDMALKALGLRRVMQIPENVGTDGIGYGVSFPIFWIDRFHPHSVRQHTAFAAKVGLRSMPSMLPHSRPAGPTRGARPTEAKLLRSICARSGWQQHRGGLPR